jgi:magnesium transporter
VNPEIEVIDIINRLKTEQEEVENVREIIVCRDDMKLEGIIKVEDLLAAEDTAKAQTVMEKATISVGANVDQELCVRYISKYDLTILPVLDNRRRILGLITVDDIIDVMEDEASEDMYRLVGVGADKPLFESPLSRALKRLPWFIVTIIGMSFLSLVMQRFEGTLKAVVGLAFFVPAVMAIGGTVGIQASTITVRGLATNELEFKNLWWLIKRELMVGVIIGLVCASLMGISSYGIMKLGIRTDQPTLSHSTTITSTTSPKQASTAKPNPVTDIFKFSLTVGLSLFLSVLGSIILGTSIPMICHRLGADPALAAGPFITTLVDVGSQIIYLSMATWLLLAS